MLVKFGPLDQAIADLAARQHGVVATRQLRALGITSYEILELTDYPSLAALARAHPGHRGARKLLATLGRYDAGANLTRATSRSSSRQLCHDHGLPTPKANTIVRTLRFTDRQHADDPHSVAAAIRATLRS